MPLLLSVLSMRDADGADFRKLRVKAMECVGFIGEILFTMSWSHGWFQLAIAVGLNVFRSDFIMLVESLIHIQSMLINYSNFLFFTSLVLESPMDPGDTQIPQYLMATWANVCQVMCPDFEPYLPAVMPFLLSMASAKADLSVYGMCTGSCILAACWWCLVVW